MSVCLFVTFVNPAKTAELFKIAVWGGMSWGLGPRKPRIK